MKDKLSPYLIGLLSVCGILGIALIGISIAIFFNITFDRPHLKLQNPTTDVLHVQVAYDTVAGNYTSSLLPEYEQKLNRLTVECDSLRRQVEILQKYDQELILDIRQETNNAIEKTNGWLAFWIATSCLVCMVVPLLVQLISTASYKKDLNAAQEEFNRRFESIKTQLDKELARIKLLQNYAMIQRGLETKLLTPLDGTNSILAKLWEECMEHTQKEMQSIVNKNEVLSCEEREELVRLLIQMYAYVSEIDASTTHHYSRTIGNIRDIIQRLYNRLTNNEILDSRQLKRETDMLLRIAKPLISNLS